LEINILHLIDGAKQARGCTVIIDVFRAFTTACVVHDNGAERFIVTERLDTVFQLRDEHPGCIMMGERHERMVPGFDFGNSPAAVMDEDFSGKLVVMTTSAGTRGIINASGADEILTGSFINAGALVRYLKKQQPDIISLVCMGYSAGTRTQEDTYCAEYIRNELTGSDSDFGHWVEEIRRTSGRRFFLPENQDHSPSADFDICLERDRYDFVLRAQKVTEDQYELIKIPG
jgi:2-phosphosulfolactate phosphatase